MRQMGAVSGRVFYFPYEQTRLSHSKLPGAPVIRPAGAAPLQRDVGTCMTASVAHGKLLGSETVLLVFVIAALDKVQEIQETLNDADRMKGWIN